MNKKILYTFYVSLVINIILLSTTFVIALELKAKTIIIKQLRQEMQVQIEAMDKMNQEPSYDNVSSTLQSIEMNEYINRSLGFSMKYPSTLEEPDVTLVPSKDDPRIGYMSLDNKISKDMWLKECTENECGFERAYDYIQIDIYKNTEKLLLKDWIIKNLPPFIYTIYDEPSEDPFEKLEYISIDGTEGFKYSSYGMYGQDIVVLLDKENNLIYLISASFVNTNATIRGDLWYLLNSFSLLNNQ